MAEGYFNHFLNDEHKVYSAGIEVHGLNPKAVLVMKESELDISHQTSNNVSEFEHITFDYVLTVCDHAKENCPFFPAQVSNLHHNFPDPAKAEGTDEEIMNAFRSCRDEIKAYCENLSTIINRI